MRAEVRVAKLMELVETKTAAELEQLKKEVMEEKARRLRPHLSSSVADAAAALESETKKMKEDITGRRSVVWETLDKLQDKVGVSAMLEIMQVEGTEDMAPIQRWARLGRLLSDMTDE